MFKQIRIGARGILLIAFAAVFVASLIGFAVGPRAPDATQQDYCVQNFRTGTIFGLSMNCDSFDFLRLAEFPGGVFEPRSTRQARPGMIYAAALFAKPFLGLRNVPGKLGIRAVNAWVPSDYMLGRHFPQYLAYLILNVLLIVASFATLLKIAGPDAPDSAFGACALFCAAALLLANDVTKAFLLSPHTQLFNILVPLIAVRFVMVAWERGFSDLRFCLWAGIVTGLGIITYGVFAILLPCVIGAGALATVIYRRAQMRQALLHAALFLLLSIAPFVAWYLLVVKITGGFYNHDVATYDQVVWIFKVFAKDGAVAVVRTFLGHLTVFLKQGLPQAAVPALMIVILIAAGAIGGVLRSVWREVARPAMAAAFVILVLTAFWATVGFAAERLAYSMVPPVVALAGVLAIAVLNALPRRTAFGVGAALVLIACADLVYVVVKSGPYS